jgi:hypothetical protein
MMEKTRKDGESKEREGLLEGMGLIHRKGRRDLI